MKKMALTFWDLATAASLILAGCTSNLPQAEREFSDYSIGVEHLSWSQKRQLEQTEQAQELNLQDHQTEANGPLVAAGFFAGRHDGYVVWRDGTVGFINSSGNLQILDRLPTRLDKALISGRQIIGLNSNGTMGAWNTSNLSQQVIIRPQDTTFNQSRVFDAVATSSGSLILAAEGERLERWSLASGNRLTSGKLRDVQPRAIAPNSERQSVVYGSLSGAIHHSRGWEAGQVICRHNGPVLAVHWLKTRNQVLSSGKDGSVLLCDMKTSKVLWSYDLHHPAYEIIVSEDEGYAAIIPALGRPLVLDLHSRMGKVLTTRPRRSTTRFVFTRDGNAISQHGASELNLWRVNRGASLGQISLDKSGEITGFAVASPQNRVAVLRDDTHVSWFDLNSRRNLGVALVSGTKISSIALSDDGQKMLLVLIDGGVLTLDAPYNQSSALHVSATVK